VIKDAKEQLRALPDGLTYGLLRYLNTDIDLAGSDPAIGFNYLGRLGAAAADMSGDLWQVSQDGLSVTGAATAVPMPLATPWDSTPAPSTPTPARTCTPPGRGRHQQLTRLRSAAEPVVV